MNEVLKLIEVIKSKITVDCDLTWTHYNAVEELIAEINLNYKLLENNNKQGLEFFQRLFAPTSTLQEMAIQNDWIQEYLNLSLAFDKLYEHLKP